MSSLFTINCCKSFSCRNLGLASSPDYDQPDYRLGYAALHCRACGSYPPLFNEEQFRLWLSAYLADSAANSGHFAQVVTNGAQSAMAEILRAVSAFSVGRVKGLDAQTTAAHTFEPPEQIATVPLIVPFQGASADQKLYVLLSFDAIRGNILHVSSNFTPYPIGDTLRYRWRGIGEATATHDDIVQRVAQRESQFYAATNLMKSSTAAPNSNATPAALFCARSLPRTAIFGY